MSQEIMTIQISENTQGRVKKWSIPYIHPTEVITNPNFHNAFWGGDFTIPAGMSIEIGGRQTIVQLIGFQMLDGEGAFIGGPVDMDGKGWMGHRENKDEFWYPLTGLASAYVTDQGQIRLFGMQGQLSESQLQTASFVLDPNGSLRITASGEETDISPILTKQGEVHGTRSILHPFIYLVIKGEPVVTVNDSELS